MFVTILVCGLLIGTGAVKAKDGIDKKDATLMNVIKSADGMQANILALKSQIKGLEDKYGSLQKQLGTTTATLNNNDKPKFDPHAEQPIALQTA